MSEIEELRQELARLRGCLVERDREAEQRELQLRASYEATVRAVHVGEGDRVAGGAVLVELDE